jgi:ABC-type transport system involved in Fe-S cluster assembly fused permease/ATPase subunit
VAFEVQPGRTVALVGPTGAGKSTLASVLVRLLDPDTGRVAYDDVDVRELAPGALASVASLVPQSTFLFDDTVRGNVTLGADLPDEDVWAALRVAQADGFVAALPRRSTPSSASAAPRCPAASDSAWRWPGRSSGGRGCWCWTTPPAVVDPQVEQRILAGLRGLGQRGRGAQHGGRRRLPPGDIALADEVVFLDEGRVAARGTHASCC